MASDLNSPRLRMVGVQKRFGATVALADVSLTARSGEVLGLVGENGAGKSTLMKILAGVHQPDEGECFLEGRRYTPDTPLEARRAGVAMIHQELALAPDLTVEENIVLGVEPGTGPLMDWRKTSELATRALATVGLGHLDPKSLARYLSPAEKQLVEIGRAVVVGCSVLVFDEPTSSLAQADIARLFRLIADLKQQGHAIIYISHFLEEVRALCDRITILRDGKSVAEGATKDLSDEQIVAKMVGRDVDDLYPRSARTRGELLLEIEKLHRGEVIGIAGLIGAGRTELLRTLFGLNEVVSGEIKVGRFAGAAAPRERWKQGVGFVSEDRKTEGLALDLSIAENMTLTRLGALVRPSALTERAQHWIERLRVKCASPLQPVIALSGGNQQKVAIARLLAHDVDVLLLDEPTRGIDIGAKAVIYQLIDELACQGKAVLVVSSYLPELLGICDRIAVMNRGVLGEAHPIAEIDAHTLMLEATGKTGAPW